MMEKLKPRTTLRAVFAVALGLASCALADTETVGGYTWTYSIGGGTAEIQPGIWPDPTGALTIPPTLGGKPVTSIGDDAFNGCSSLTSVTIPNNVMNIGNAAFNSCIALTSVTIPNNVTSIGSDAFYGCSALTSVTIPNSVTTIGDGAFADCSSLASVTIPNSVTDIGRMVFNGCSGLTSVTIPNSVTSIGECAFAGCISLTSVTIPNSVTDIGESAFSGCSGLTSVTIPNSVTSLGIGAFYGCSDLMSVTIPDGLTSVGGDVFNGCSSLTSVTIPNGVTSIGSYAFYGCSGLTSVSLPDSLTSIGDCAFAYCSGLTSLTIPNSVTSIGIAAFEFCTAMTDVYYYADPAALTWGGTYSDFKDDKSTKIHVGAAQLSAFESKFGSTVNATFVSGDGTETVGGYTWSYRLVDGNARIYKDDPSYPGDGTTAVSPEPTGAVTIPSTLGGKTVTGIGNGALCNCNGMTSVTIPAGVTSIGDSAFQYCSGMTSVMIPDSVTSIGWGAFWSCGLTSVTIPATVTSVGANAFYRCTAMADVYCHPDPASLTWGDASDSFKSDNSTKIHVKVAQLSDYESKFGSTVNATFVGDLDIFTVTFDANGGSVSPTTRSVVGGEAVGELPTPTFSGYTFAGWFTAESGGTQISAATTVTANVTYYAHWTVSGGGTGEGGGSGEGGGRGEGGGTGEGGGSGEGGGTGGEGGGSEPVTPDPGPCYVALDEGGITAPYAAPKAVKLHGVAYNGCDVTGIIELKLGKVNAKKKTSRVSGSFTGLDGKKITIKAVPVTGVDGSAPVAVSLKVKGLGTMNVTIGGTQFAGSLGGWHVQSADVGGSWNKAGAKVYVDMAAGSGTTALPTGTIENLLPDGEPVIAKGGKWAFAKAARVKWSKLKNGAPQPEIFNQEAGKGLVIDTSKGGNLSAMKLTYTPKKGTFKGSFKVYALEGAGKATKLKKYTVKVTGVVVDGVGYGVAICKKPAARWTVTVE